MKRFLALLLAAVMILSLAACGKKAEPAATEAPAPAVTEAPAPVVEEVKEEDIVILFTNDVHCGIEENIGYAGLAAYRNQMLKQTPNVLWLIPVTGPTAIPSVPFPRVCTWLRS